MKECKSCHEVKPSNDFYKHKGSKDGLRTVCKKCHGRYNYKYEKRFRKLHPDVLVVNNKTEHSNIYFGGKREQVIKRDGEKCVKCGMTRAEHRVKYSRDITVDHIDGLGRNTSVNLRNNDLENLQTLCLACHGKKDTLRKGQVA